MNETINLSKGQRIDLTKVAPNTSKFAFALGWNPQKFDGKAFDLDATAFLTKDGKASSVADFVFYGMSGFDASTGIKNYKGFISHSGDDQTGGKAGDDEIITVDVTKIDTNIYNDIQFNVTIYEADVRKQTFGQVDDAFIRVYDVDTQKEICRYDLTEDYSGNTAIVVGRLYFKDGSWRFQSVGGGYNGGLSALCSGVGLSANNG